MDDNDRGDFLDWLTTADGGSERPYADHLDELVALAARLRLVVRGWNPRIGKFCVRLRQNIGQGIEHD